MSVPEEHKKEIKGFTIEVGNGVAKIIPEDKTNHWYRNVLDRQKDGILCPEILQDMYQTARKLDIVDEKGIGKCNAFMVNLSPNPKSSQGRLKTEYKNALIEKLEKEKSKIIEFKDKKVKLHISIYLRKERFEKQDVDNFIKVIVDSLKPFIGDDKNIISVSAEKKELENYTQEDMDFLEQVVITIIEIKT
jgi:Holliday junction resolvase RusA-like endonuclease